MNNTLLNPVGVKAERDAVALELDKAVASAMHVGKLKQSQWYQDRKELLQTLDAWLERFGG